MAKCARWAGLTAGGWVTAALLAGCALSPCEAREHAVQGSATRIELKEEVQVRRQQVNLGEVANITSRDLPTLQRLMALALGEVPRSGDPVSLDRDVLKRWIQERMNMDPQQIAWSGAAKSRIALGRNAISGEQVAASAQEQLSAVLKRNGWHGEVALVEVPRDVDVPVGRLELKMRPLVGWRLSGRDGVVDEPLAQAQQLPPKRQSVWVDLWVDGEFVRTVPVAFEVSVHAPAYVASADLTAGQIIDPARPQDGSLSVREVDWSGRRLLTPPASVDDGPKGAAARGPLRLRRRVAAGQALTEQDVEPAPMVARGDYATLHSTQGAIELDSRVEVLQDGAVGQAVRVKLPNASSAIVARVTGPGEVEIRQ